MKIYLIRHGKTLANELHIYCGSTDLPLTEVGIEELKALHYDFPPSCRFLTSGMIRTEQTLYYLCGDVAHKMDKRFREIVFGIFEMQCKTIQGKNFKKNKKGRKYARAYI